MADALDRPWEQFYERISAQMAKTYELNDGVLDFLPWNSASGWSRSAC